MGVFSHKHQNTMNNQKGYTQKEKDTVNKLGRSVARSQKLVDTKGSKATNKQGNGKTR